MPSERRDPPTLLTPLEWRVLLRYAATERLSTDAITRWLRDDGNTDLDEATESRLRTLVGRRADRARDR